MIERTAEFNAQILAFLTGDARYLEYAAPPAADEGGDEPPEDARHTASTLPGEEDGEALHGDAPYEGAPGAGPHGAPHGEPRGEPHEGPYGGGPADDTADRSAGGEVEPPCWSGRAEEPPKVRRKRGGVYPARGREPESRPEVSSNGTENGIENGDEGRGSFRREDRRATSGGDVIPELPEDLFDWPEPRGGGEPRPRYQGDAGDAPPDASEDHDGPEGSWEPPGPHPGPHPRPPRS